MTVLTDVLEPATAFDDGIQVIEYPDIEASASNGVFGAVLASYRHEGYEAGRTRAVNDILAALVPVAEEFLRNEPAPPAELRKFIYRFSDLVEQHLLRDLSKGAFVQDGLGI